jgi:hypothetical protein
MGIGMVENRKPAGNCREEKRRRQTVGGRSMEERELNELAQMSKMQKKRWGRREMENGRKKNGKNRKGI